MKILLNGETRNVDDRLTVAALMADMDIPMRGVAVEVNLEVVPQNRFNAHRLDEGDRVEIVTFVGGG